MSALTSQMISRLAAEYGFSAAYCFAPLPEDHAPEAVRSLALLVRTYTPGGRLMDRFYPCSNAAYHQARRMAAAISEAYDVQVFPLSSLPLKPMCRRLPAFGTGRNTLNYLPAIGSRFCLELLGFSEDVGATPMQPYAAETLPCAQCMRCAAACPTGAITARGFVRERCIRHHMLSGKPMPEEMRVLIGSEGGARGILGCDICQRVCPANAAVEKERVDTDEFQLSELLACSSDTLQRFAALYGRNYAIRNRILAQAVLAAYNLEGSCFANILRTLISSPSAPVVEHATWAMQKIEEGQKNKDATQPPGCLISGTKRDP